MPRRKKIIILGDAGSVHLRRWAAGLNQRGYEIIVVSLGGRSIENIETFILPITINRTISYFLNIGKVRKIVRENNPDLIHSHYATGFGMWGMYAGFHPFLLSVWGSDIPDPKSGSIKKWLTARALKSADHITATGQYLRDKTIKFQPLDKNKISVVHFGAKLKPIHTAQKDDNTLRIAYIKAHEGIYGPHILLKAIHRTIQSGHDINLSMAGEGSMTGILKKMTADMDIESRVDFTGFIEHNSLHEFLCRHDVMVMPSYRESFGVAALEASAAGLPVIASNIDGIPEVVIEDKTGILIPPGDSDRLSQEIAKLAENAELRNSMGKAGRTFVEENYDWEKSLDLMSTIYEKMISGESLP